MQKYLISLLMLVILSGCSIFTGSNNNGNLNNYQPIEIQQVLELLCNSDSNCLELQCPDLERCPLTIALSHPVIFDFVTEYAACDGCNTPDFSPAKGIGKCIEYQIQPLDENHEVELWVSANCNFRYAQPEETHINMMVNVENGTIQRISPPSEFIGNSTYCQQNSDCRCLSGSGVELIGCSNFFHAPLNWSGYYEGEACGCVEENCVRMDQESP